MTPGPNSAGFDRFFGVINSHNLPPYVLVENEEILGLKPGDHIAIEGERKQTSGPRLRDEHALEAIQAAEAVDFISQHRGQPFFLYYAAAAVHDPYTPGTAWQGTSEAGVYGDYVQEFDGAVGEVLAALDRFGLSDRTIVIGTSDNGAQGGRAAKYGHRCNGDLRGEKGTAWEGGHRVAFFVRWSGRVPAGTISDEVVCHVDCIATLCAALGLELPSGAGPDSHHVLPAWLAQTTDRPIREATVCIGRSVYSIRQGPWKLLVNGDENRRVKGSLEAPQLFDLSHDPAEQNNLASTHSQKFRELTLLLSRYRTQDHTRPDWKALSP